MRAAACAAIELRLYIGTSERTNKEARRLHTTIGVMWRNEKKFAQALGWFKKAVATGDDESSLEIAKYYLAVKNNPAKAVRYLKTVVRSNRCSEAGVEEAKGLLKQLS